MSFEEIGRSHGYYISWDQNTGRVLLSKPGFFNRYGDSIHLEQQAPSMEAVFALVRSYFSNHGS